jgi:hypothetical protein
MLRRGDKQTVQHTRAPKNQYPYFLFSDKQMIGEFPFCKSNIKNVKVLVYAISNTISVIPMALEETVCAKVPAELKKKLAKLGVNVSQVIRESLQAEVDRLEKERLNKLAKEVSVILQKIPPEEFAQSIRVSRDNR